MRTLRRLAAFLVGAIALVLAGCGQSPPGPVEEPVVLEPLFGEPFSEDFPDYSRDPYAHIGLEEMEAAWQEWQRPDKYDAETAKSVDPSTDRPLEVAYMALLAWVAGDPDGIERYWSPRFVQAPNLLYGEVGGEGGFKECFSNLDDEDKYIVFVNTKVFSTQVDHYDLVELHDTPPRAQPDTNLWFVKAKVFFKAECMDRTFTPQPIPLRGVQLQVGAYWLPREHRFAAVSIMNERL